jgi:type I restriction enzyme S subunit
MSNKKSKGTFMPKLRFPEFRNAQEWERKKISELLFETKQRNRNLEYSPKDVLSVSGEYGIVNQIELLGRSYAGVSVKDYHIVETGDIVYTKSPLKKNPFGIIKENKGKPGIVSTLYAVYRATDKAYSTYLDHYFSRDYNLNSYLQPIVRKGAKNDMKVNNFAVLGGEILIPKIDEQQKIADCLTSLDELISAQREQVDALKEYKKGLLQNIFPPEGESLPRLRFPEFESAPEWEEKKLESFCKIGDIDHKMPLSVADGIPYIMTGDFFGINNIDFDNAKKISTEDYEQLSKKIKPEFGDIIIARYASVGAVRYIETKIRFLVSYSCAIIKCNKSENSKYLYYIFQSDAIQSKIGLEINMSSQKNIGTDSIKKLNIFLPTLPEQQKIAELLTSLDEEIEAQGQRLAALQVHKKGLLQGLFPSAGEVEE